MQNQALMQGGPQRAVNAVLQVQLAAPPDDLREQVAVERRVLGQQLLQIKRILGGDELIEANGTGRDLSPFPGSAGMIGVRPPVPDLLKDHLSSLVEDPVPPLARDDRAPSPGPRPGLPPLPPSHHPSQGRNYTALRPVRDLGGGSFRRADQVLAGYGGEFS